MLRSCSYGLLAVACLFALAPAAYAQSADNAAQNTIIVTGRTPEATRSYVEQLTIAPGTAEQLARWDRTICTSVAGLPARQGQFLADRIAQRAFAVGLQPGEPGCTANVAIFVTADANAMAQSMSERDPVLFASRPETNINTLGPVAFNDFLNTDRPVRWWHVSERRSAEGFSLSGDASMGGMSNAPAVRSSGSRLSNNTRQDFSRVIIIVDSRRVGGAQLSAIADYIAMVALADINPSADASSFPTILGLFSQQPAGGAAPTAMTDWDIAYLDGLYHSTRNASSVQQQQREITDRMLARS